MDPWHAGAVDPESRPADNAEPPATRDPDPAARWHRRIPPGAPGPISPGSAPPGSIPPGYPSTGHVPRPSRHDGGPPGSWSAASAPPWYPAGHTPAGQAANRWDSGSRDSGSWDSGSWDSDSWDSGSWRTARPAAAPWPGSPAAAGYTTDPRYGDAANGYGDLVPVRPDRAGARHRSPAGAAGVTPASAGRPHPAAAWDGYQQPTSGARGQPPAVRQARPDSEPGVDSGYGPILGWTALWYAIPMLVWVVWAATRSSLPDPSCRGAVGTVCPTGRAEAFTLLISSTPRIGMAIALSVAAALVVRLLTGTWRAMTVALVGAVVGGGIVTIFGSVF